MRLIIYFGCIFVYGLVLEISLGGSLELCNHCDIGHSCTDNTTDGTCKCLAGFHGHDTCEDNNECHNARRDVCGHRGACHNTIGSYICNCLNGWDGMDHCDTNTTLNPPCMPGWHGYKCDDSFCAPHGYAKYTSLTDYICVCDRGWRSNNVSGPCDVDIDECKLPDTCPEHSNCTNTPGRYKCSCLASWTQRDCSFYNVCQVQSCSNNRTCGKLGGDSDSSYNCTCLPAATNCTDEEFWSHRNSDNHTDADHEGASTTVLIGSIAGGTGVLILLLIAGLIVYKFYKKGKVDTTQNGSIGSENSKNFN